MNFKITVFQNNEGIFAEVLDENNKSICVGDGESPYKAVKDACSVLSNIMDFAEQEEDKEILEMIKERDKNDTGKRHTLEEVKRMRMIKEQK